MPLTPQDIVRKEFREALRGYNQADVDLFLDEVMEELSRLVEESQKLKVRVAALQQEVARLREGRGGAAPVDPPAIEAEVRARLRRFLEEQLRALEHGQAQTPTAGRIAREMRDVQRAPESSPRRERERDREREETQEPFWAGE